MRAGAVSAFVTLTCVALGASSMAAQAQAQAAQAQAAQAEGVPVDALPTQAAPTQAAPTQAAPTKVGPTAPRMQSLTLDAARTSLVVRTYRDGARATLAHDHVIKAAEVSGEASWDPGQPETLRVKVVVQAKSLVVDDPTERARLGLTDVVSDKDKKAVDEALKGRDTLDARRYPTLSFRSTRVARDAAGALSLTGELTLHGVTRPLTVPLTLATAPDGTVTGQTSFTVKTSDHGIRPYSAFLGAVKVKDEVDFHLTLVATPRAP